MIPYILKSSLSLLLLFGFYKLFLEREKLHTFKRFYLLFSLVFSFIIPLVSFAILTDFVPAIAPESAKTIDYDWESRIDTNPTESPDNTSLDALFLIYWIVTGGLFIRFSYNIVSLIRTINRHFKLRFERAILVLLPGNCLPYAFLHYVFVSQTAYENKQIERELLTHELAHVRQKHSIDVLLIELLISVFWFNPVLFFLKRAIQLNHEFLADAFVNQRHLDIVHYQQLLLSKLMPVAPISLASNLMFQTTKHRFIMMTKQTSRIRAILVSTLSITLFGLLAVIFCTKSVAQNPAVTKSALPAHEKPQADPIDLEKRFKDKLVTIHSKSRHNVQKKFSELSADEKKKVVYIPPQLRKTPTEAQFIEWRNPKMFGIWLDGKHVKNGVLAKYKSSDIASFYGSYVHKNARQPEGYLYQMDLMTHPEYERYLKEEEESPFLFVRNNDDIKHH